jgi:hypothetical protein
VRRLLQLLVALVFCSCDGGDIPGNLAPDSRLAGPEGIALLDGTVYVANVNSRYDASSGLVVFDDGFLQTYDVLSHAPGDRMELPCENPQSVVVAETRLLVVCSGSMLPDDQGLLTPATDGALLLVDPVGLTVTATIPVAAGAPHPLAGFPGALAWSADHETVWLGSGSGPYVHAVSLVDQSVTVIELTAPDNRNDLVVPVFLDGRLFATSFAAGALFEIVPETGVVLAAPLPITESGDIEGTVDAIPGDGGLYVLHSLSQRVVFVDPAARTVTPLFTAGAAANRIRRHDGALYVLNSMDNNLTRHDLASGKTVTPFAIFPPGTNPWEMTFADNTMWVTAYLSNEVHLVDATTGEGVATLR